MKAILFTGRNELSLTDLPDPTAGPGEVVVAVRASGICHTDLEVLRANYGTGAFPLVPGHEYSGVVVEVGDGVAGLAPGDRVVVDPNLECGACPACRRGWAHLCEDLGAYGVTRNGGFAEFSVVRAAAVHRIGEMPFDIAALAEPMGCVLNGLQAANAARARSALIFGAGPMGLLMAIGLRTRGVAEITLVDIDEARMDLGRSFGFGVAPPGSAELDGLRRSVDLVVDATGVTSVAAHLTDYVANGGTCHYFGVCPSEARIEIAPFEVFRRQLTLVGSHSLNHNVDKALVAIRACGPDIARLVSHRLPLDDIASILRVGPPGGGMKIQARLD